MQPYRTFSQSFKKHRHTPTKDLSIKAFVNDPSHIRAASSCSHIRIVNQIKSTRNAEDLIQTHKKKLPDLKQEWSNRRDISFLKDKKPSLITTLSLTLPTDIPSLAKQGDPVSPSLGNPSGRQDIQNLANWFTFMKEKHRGDIKESAVVYYSCFKEIARQVSVHCVHRGKLLSEVLNDIEAMHAEKTKIATKELVKENELLVEGISNIKKENME